MNNSLNVTLTAMLKQVFSVLLAEEIHTCLPGKIQSYDSKTRKAVVIPQLKKKYLDGSELIVEPIPGVPVAFLGAGKSGLRLPEKEIVGQTVTLVFSERSLDNWLLKGDLTEPGDNRKFDMSDAIAVCYTNSFNNEDSGGDDLELFYNDSVVRIKENGNIEIGVGAFLKLMNENFQPLYNNHVHNFTAAPSGVFSTSKPAQSIGTIPTADFGGVVVGFESRITNNEMTTKVKGE